MDITLLPFIIIQYSISIDYYITWHFSLQMPSVHQETKGHE